MNRPKEKLSTLLLSLCVSLFLISISVKLTLAFRQLYYFDIDYLNISKSYGMPKEEIIKNYNILIDYLQDKNITKLSMPSFPTSREGEIHFIEVKDIFMKFNALLYLTGVISIIGAIVKLRKRSCSFLKQSSIGLLAIPAVLSVPFAVNFDKSFTAFHKIFFNNNYWQFDPVRDPIINVLPQEFFLHSAILILILFVIFSAALLLLYKGLSKSIK